MLPKPERNNQIQLELITGFWEPHEYTRNTRIQVVIFLVDTWYIPLVPYFGVDIFLNLHGLKGVARIACMNTAEGIKGKSMCK